jgi:glycogen(starch) synthase
VRVALLARAAHPLHDPGGMERAVFTLATHLRSRGVESVLVTRPATRGGDFPGEVMTVPWGPTRMRHGRVLERTLHYPRFAARVGDVAAALVRAGRVDVVDAQGLTALGYGRLRRDDRSLRAPLVMNPQGMEEHKTRGLKRLALAPLRRLSREAAALSDRVVATDDATRGEVSTLLGVDPARVVVLPNGIDAAAIERMTPTDARAHAETALPALFGASPVLLSVGRLEAYKGFGDVALALQSAHARGALPARWRWVVVGEGPGRAALERSLGALHAHVTLAGRVDEPLLHALYARADVFVHATRFEGSSLVTLEAMAHGLPVVATRAGGIPDKVEDGVSGRLVAPGDVAALGQAIADLCASAADREAMGARGKARALASFAWPALADRVIALYETVLREARA